MEEALIKTLCYSDIFEYPLTVHQIHQYLICPQKVSLNQIQMGLHTLVRAGKLSKQKSRVDLQTRYVLQNRDNLFRDYDQRLLISANKQLFLDNNLALLTQHPYVLGVFLTGSLAMNNAQENDDIDLMVITQAGKLWQTRLKIMAILETHGLRRRPNQLHSGRSVNNKFCLNLWLDTSSLVVPEVHQNLYTAHEVVQAKLLFERSPVHAVFLRTNHWVHQFLANTQFYGSVSPGVQTESNSGWLEKLCFGVQRLYMQHHRTHEKISPHMAYFHPRELATPIYEAYQARLKKYL